ncbi:MAG: class I SAM-dependent methyltransferase family protein [Candidatus Bathyarchaeota archaeon]|jgi:tRNA (guanine37-N1)-methyltransferase|nr:MAG: class I SAM-dependent methyltransferase family protein [Candidatus Bathyarchaeota archaeon]
MRGDLKTVLKGKLPCKAVASIYRSYDVIGDIAVIRIPEPVLSYGERIAQALLQHKNIKSVWRQSSPVSGDFRLRELEWIAGEKKTETIHKEYGCIFKLDIKECYFSPRLGFERMRIADNVREGDIIVNMFAGVGSYSIVIAKNSGARRIYSIDINPRAVEYMKENVLLNRVTAKVIPIEGDAETIIETKLRNSSDRILMPLPEKASEYVGAAISALKKTGHGWIHYYDFQHTKKEEELASKATVKLTRILEQLGVRFIIPNYRVVRQTGPKWYQIAIDVRIEGAHI